MEFNNKLYELRKQKGFSQEVLVNRLNVSRQTVSKWEVGTSFYDVGNDVKCSMIPPVLNGLSSLQIYRLFEKNYYLQRFQLAWHLWEVVKNDCLKCDEID